MLISEQMSGIVSGANIVFCASRSAASHCVVAGLFHWNLKKESPWRLARALLRLVKFLRREAPVRARGPAVALSTSSSSHSLSRYLIYSRHSKVTFSSAHWRYRERASFSRGCLGSLPTAEDMSLRLSARVCTYLSYIKSCRNYGNTFAAHRSLYTTGISFFSIALLFGPVLLLLLLFGFIHSGVGAADRVFFFHFAKYTRGLAGWLAGGRAKSDFPPR